MRKKKQYLWIFGQSKKLQGKFAEFKDIKHFAQDKGWGESKAEDEASWWGAIWETSKNKGQRVQNIVGRVLRVSSTDCGFEAIGQL